jgi:hypothetical protein
MNADLKQMLMDYIKTLEERGNRPTFNDWSGVVLAENTLVDNIIRDLEEMLEKCK